jgi:integrase
MAYIKGQTSQGTIFKIGNVYYANYRRDNKRYKVSLKTKDRAIALLKLQELTAHPMEYSPQFARLLHQTLDMMQLKGLKSFDTVEYHARAVKKALGPVQVKDISSLTIQRTTLGWLKQKVAPATINRRLYVIRQTLKQAVLHGYILSLPAITNLSERGNERQGFFSPEEFQNLYAELPDYLKDACLFGYITGWRRSEITGLQWSSMRWDTMVLRLPTSKNGEQRIFPVRHA